MRKVDVSIVTPAFNAERHIDKFISSVIGQDFPNMEAIVVNDGSTDNTLARLWEYKQQYEQQYPGLIRIIHSEHNGAGSGRNIGIDEAQGEYIYFADIDDTIEKECISNLYSLADKYGYSYIKTAQKKVWSILPFISYIDRINIPTKGDQVIEIQSNRSELTNDFGVAGKLIRKSLIGDLRFPERNRWEDIAFSTTLKAKAGTIMHCDIPYYKVKLHFDSSGLTPTHKKVNLLEMQESLEALKLNLENINMYGQYENEYKTIYVKNMCLILYLAACWQFMPNNDKRKLINSIISLIGSENKEWTDLPENHKGINGFILNRYSDKSLQTNDSEEAKMVMQKLMSKYVTKK